MMCGSHLFTIQWVPDRIVIKVILPTLVLGRKQEEHVRLARALGHRMHLYQLEQLS